MARPIAYDRARVIELAALQFWEDGFGDCNVDDLTRRAGVNRHSLYAAFGGKAGLYLDALDFYVATVAAPYLAILEGGDDLDDLVRFFATVARDGFDARGCLVTNSVVELGRSDAKVAAIVDRYYARYVAAFAGLVTRAQAGGTIRADLDPDAVARWLLVTAQGMSVAARLGAPGPDLAEIVRQALAPPAVLIATGEEAMPDCTSLTLDRHLAPAGVSAESFARLWAGLWTQRRIPPDLLELCRLTFARLHDDAGEMAAANPAVALTAGQRDAVLAGQAPADPAYAAALLFAEYYWLDAQSITDEGADAVKTHYGEPGLVLLIEALGLIDGRIRAARCLRDLSAHTSAKEAVHV